MISSTLNVGPDVAGTQGLASNRAICTQGVKLVGEGFSLDATEVRDAGGCDGAIVKPFISNRDLVQNPSHRCVIDFSGFDERQAREAHPWAFQRLYETVRPLRQQNRDAQRRRNWWLFGRSNEQMRNGLERLPRFILTPEVAKHRPFIFVASPTIPDASTYVVASDDAYLLAVLSSRVHAVWALRAGGHLGVGNDPRYQRATCFDPFPFAFPSMEAVASLRSLGEQLDAHRKRQQAAHAQTDDHRDVQRAGEAAQRRGVDGERAPDPRAGAGLGAEADPRRARRRRGRGLRLAARPSPTTRSWSPPRPPSTPSAPPKEARHASAGCAPTTRSRRNRARQHGARPRGRARRGGRTRLDGGRLSAHGGRPVGARHVSVLVAE
jgi:hypothetical protein